MRIGLSIRTFYPRSGGLQAHAAQLARELTARGHEVRIITRSISHTPSYQDFFLFSEAVRRQEVSGFPVSVLRRSGLWKPALWGSMKCLGRSQTRELGVWLYRAAFQRQMQEALAGVDLVHHVGQGSEMIGFAAEGAARALRVPFVVQPTIHPGQWGDAEIDFRLYRRADRLLVHTEYEADYFRRKNIAAPISVVGNGIEDRADGDADKFRARYHLGSGPIVLFLGRKDADKGYPVLREAFGLVRQQRGDATLACMGPGAVPGPVSQGKTVDSGGFLELEFGDATEKHDALAACSLLCVPSEAESFGLVYMEAGRYGKPLIGRKLPVLDELLGNRDAAVLVGAAHGAGNCTRLEPAELAQAVLRVLGDASLSKRLGENARCVSEQFIWPKVVTRFEAAQRLAIEDFTGRAVPATSRSRLS